MLPPVADGQQRYVVYFVSNHHDFRLPELRGAAAAEGVSLQVHLQPQTAAFVVFDSAAPLSQLRRALSRCATAKFFARLWGYGPSWDECLAAAATPQADAQAGSFRLQLEAFGLRSNDAHKQQIFEVGGLAQALASRGKL